MSLLILFVVVTGFFIGLTLVQRRWILRQSNVPQPSRHWFRVAWGLLVTGAVLIACGGYLVVSLTEAISSLLHHTLIASSKTSLAFALYTKFWVSLLFTLEGFALAMVATSAWGLAMSARWRER